MAVVITEGETPASEELRVETIEGALQTHYAISVIVNEDICCGCRTCESICDNQNISYDEKRRIVRINEDACKGCESCVAACPSGALFQRFFSDGQIFAEIGFAQEGISCESCPLAVVTEFDVPEGKSIRLMCSGYVDSSLILKSFELGIDGFMVISCYFGLDGRKEAENSIEVAKEVMEVMGLNPEKIRMEWISPMDPEFEGRMKEFMEIL